MFAASHTAGMPPLDIIRAVTINAAGMLGWQDRAGSIEPEDLRISSPSPEMQSPALRSWNESDS